MFLTRELSAFYGLNEASGSAIWVDNVNGNNVTPSGSIGSRAGMIGQAAEFDVGNEFLFRDNAVFVKPQAGSATLSFWFYLDDDSAESYFIALRNGGDFSYWAYFREDLHAIQFEIVQANGTQISAFSPNDSVASGQWHHCVCIAEATSNQPSAGQMRVFLDGVQSGSTVAYNGTMKTQDNLSLYFGVAGNNSGTGLDGAIDAAGIWSGRTFESAGERQLFVDTLYNSGSGIEITPEDFTIEGFEIAFDEEQLFDPIITGFEINYDEAILFDPTIVGFSIQYTEELQTSGPLGLAGINYKYW